MNGCASFNIGLLVCCFSMERDHGYAPERHFSGFPLGVLHIDIIIDSLNYRNG